MARGWESKSVEQQQDEAASDRAPKKAPASPEQIAVEQKRLSLELSRSRIQQQLQNACNSRHRQMLETALADLEKRLADIHS